MAALLMEAFLPTLRSIGAHGSCSKQKSVDDDDGDDEEKVIDWVSSGLAEKAESLFLTVDWIFDVSYIIDIATRTATDVTDAGVRTCLTKRLVAAASNLSSCNVMVVGALETCEAPEPWGPAPTFIVVMLCIACAAGIVGDIHRCVLLERLWRAKHNVKHGGYFGGISAKGEVASLDQTKNTATIVATLLEDGVSLSATVILESRYIGGSWSLLAQLNVSQFARVLYGMLC
jgi:hypothetical protein